MNDYLVLKTPTTRRAEEHLALHRTCCTDLRGLRYEHHGRALPLPWGVGISPGEFAKRLFPRFRL